MRRSKDRTGEDVTSAQELVSPELGVHEHVRPKYAFRYYKNTVSSPPLPDRPITHGIARLGLIAKTIVSKLRIVLVSCEYKLVENDDAHNGRERLLEECQLADHVVGSLPKNIHDNTAQTKATAYLVPF